MGLLFTKLSMRLNGVLLISGLICFSLLAGCAQGRHAKYSYYTGVKNPRAQDSSKTNQKQTKSKPTSSAKNRNQTYYYVKKGDTLYSIAWQYGYDTREVATWNRVRWPYTIYPKQKLRVKPPKKNKKVTKTPSKRSSKPKSTSYRSTTSQTAKSSSKKQKRSKISWQWPTKGKVIGKFSARESGKKGLDIAGKKGQPVYSASGGQVVYSGSGLRGYGNLVIIKHNDTFFSAYAHNHRLHVKEKQKVKKGQHIADMGSSEAERAMLHFEVRRNGKPVDPKRYLPKRR